MKEGLINAVNIMIENAEIYLPLDELVDKAKELECFNKDKKQLEGELKCVKGKLNNQGFVAKASAKGIEEEKNRAIM